MVQPVKTDHKQAFIEYAEQTCTDPRPWNENGENWLTGEGLAPVEFFLSPRWDDLNRGKTP